MTSMLSSERENSIRRETALRLEKILKSGSSITKWLPLYELEIATPEVRTVSFVALDSKKKGKKRIFTTRGAVPSKDDMFISYMSRKDIKRLDYRLGKADRELLRRQRRMNIFADRWVVTVGKPATEISMFCELWARFRMVELQTSKSNRPPEGDNRTAYALNSDYIPDYSENAPKIVCRLKRLHKGDINDRRPSLGVY